MIVVIIVLHFVRLLFPTLEALEDEGFHGTEKEGK